MGSSLGLALLAERLGEELGLALGASLALTDGAELMIVGTELGGVVMVGRNDTVPSMEGTGVWSVGAALSTELGTPLGEELSSREGAKLGTDVGGPAARIRHSSCPPPKPNSSAEK